MINKSSPLVSVVMPVYNAQLYLSLAVKSILAQTYKNFEFIIVDDASTDSTPKILNDFNKIDKRIILLKDKTNLGVTKSLNIGVSKAKGKYIIRMDADDWSYPERFELQVELMEKNPSVIVSGSYIKVCNSKLETI